jgi:hypothetical protein
VRIDRFDRQYILMLNDIAASQRKLMEVSATREAAGVYRALLNVSLFDLDRAVAVALRRTA